MAVTSPEVIGLALDNLQSPVFAKDPDGRYVYLNKLSEALLGVVRDEAYGKTDHDLFPPHLAKLFLQSDEQAKQTRKPVQYETSMVVKGEKRLFLTMKEVYVNPDGRSGILGIGQEVTALRGLENQLEETHRRLSRDIIQAQEQAMEMVARDLHDGLAQRLSAIRLLASTITSQLHEHAQRDSGERLVAELHQVLRECRRISYGLHPLELQDYGLEAAARNYIESRGDEGVDITLTAHGVGKKLPREVEVTVYRVLQEAVSNAIRHGRPTRIDVRLSQNGEYITLEVDDNGKGLDETDQRTGMGMRSMKDRVELVDGTFAVTSPKQGTRVRVQVPLTD